MRNLVEERLSISKVVRKLGIAALLLVFGPGMAWAQTQPQGPPAFVTLPRDPNIDGVGPGGVRAGHVLVRFKALPRQDVLDRLNADFGAKVVGRIAGIRVTHFQVAGSGLALLEHLRKRSDVEFAEFDSIVQTMQGTFVPNDPYYGAAYTSSHYGNIDQWGPPAVSAPAAWGVTQGLRSVIIAVVDTGVDDTHPDLASKIVGEFNYVKGESIKDGFGHGTHVAGIAAGATNNNVGVAGMCPNCGIFSVKVLNDQGSGYISDVASGITYAASHGARVISLSLGGSGRSETLHSALDYALANNALPVCAMGNAGSSLNTPEPAYWHDCLSVVATDQNGVKASFSNYGVKADVAAPGVAILSTMPTYPVTLTTTYGYSMNYDALSGTSMATPMISGIAGLVLSQNPSLTPRQVAGIIEAASGDGSSWNSLLAFGLVNAAEAVSNAVHSDLTAPVTNFLVPSDGSSVAGTVIFQAQPTDNTIPHHVDFVKDGTRFIQVLTVSTSPAWTGTWSSTTMFNGTITLSVFSQDVFGNASAPQSLGLVVQNRLITQSGTAHVCWPSSQSCPNTVWQPVTTGVATEAATHLQGTVSYDALNNTKYADFWVQVLSYDSAGNSQAYYCGTSRTTVDCYPSVLLEPDTVSGKRGNKTTSFSNFSGGQIDLVSTSGKTASGSATINWTLTYPQ